MSAQVTRNEHAATTTLRQLKRAQRPNSPKGSGAGGDRLCQPKMHSRRLPQDASQLFSHIMAAPAAPLPPRTESPLSPPPSRDRRKVVRTRYVKQPEVGRVQHGAMRVRWGLSGFVIVWVVEGSGGLARASGSERGETARGARRVDVWVFGGVRKCRTHHRTWGALRPALRVTGVTDVRGQGAVRAPTAVSRAEVPPPSPPSLSPRGGLSRTRSLENSRSLDFGLERDHSSPSIRVGLFLLGCSPSRHSN